MSKCESCNTEFSEHLGIIATCGQLQEANKQIEELEKENERRGNLLEDVVNEVSEVEHCFYGPNAAGTPQYLEPTPAEMVAKMRSILEHQITVLKNGGVIVEAQK